MIYKISEGLIIDILFNNRPIDDGLMMFTVGLAWVMALSVILKLVVGITNLIKVR